jgi:hypothetical protein
MDIFNPRTGKHEYVPIASSVSPRCDNCNEPGAEFRTHEYRFCLQSLQGRVLPESEGAMSTYHPHVQLALPFPSGCRRCGHGLGLTTVRWFRSRFCCGACRTQYRARFWRDFRQRWFIRRRTSPG